MSSKLPISVKTLSGPSIWEEEWKEEDLEDLDPDNSGGELGVGQTVVMISCSQFRSTGPPLLPRVSKTTGWGKNRRMVGGRGVVGDRTQGSALVSSGSKARGDISGVDKQRITIVIRQRERSEMQAQPQPDENQIRCLGKGNEDQEAGLWG